MSHSPKLRVKKCNAATSSKAIEVEVEANTIQDTTIEQLLECQLKITAESEDDAETCPLPAGNPFFNVFIPTKMYPDLPSATIPSVFTYHGKKWKMVYCGGSKPRRILREDWKIFTQDNDVKIGDACVFELTKYSSDHLELKVQILRGDFPTELLQRVKGLTETNPMTIE